MGVNLVPIRSRSDSESPAVMTRRKTIVTLRWLRRALASSVSGALCGLLAAAVAVGVAELVAAITGPQGSPVVAVGDSAIDLTPIPVKDFAITHFGSNDKTVLVTGILLLLAGFAGVIGVLARRWLAAGLGGLAVVGALGVRAGRTRPDAAVADLAPTLAGVAVAMITLIILVRTERNGKITLRQHNAVPPELAGPGGLAGSSGPTRAGAAGTGSAGPGKPAGSAGPGGAAGHGRRAFL